MKLLTENKTIVLKEIFDGIKLVTKSGEEMYIYMKDNGFEFTHRDNWYSAKDGFVGLKQDEPRKYKGLGPPVSPLGTTNQRGYETTCNYNPVTDRSFGHEPDKKAIRDRINNTHENFIKQHNAEIKIEEGIIKEEGEILLDAMKSDKQKFPYIDHFDPSHPERTNLVIHYNGEEYVELQKYYLLTIDYGLGPMNVIIDNIDNETNEIDIVMPTSLIKTWDIINLNSVLV